MPFLENVTRGRNVSRERLALVATHYAEFGGVSPINQETRELIAALERRFEADGPRLPIYWGNRNWHPFLEPAVKKMADDGIRRALAFVTAAYSSYSTCRQYIEDIEQARTTVGSRAPLIEKIRPYWNHPGFIDTMVRQTTTALGQLPRTAAPDTVRLVFTAHSIPLAMAEHCDYEAQLREAAALVIERLDVTRSWDLAFQSRSGMPSQPWLEPDIVDHLAQLREDGVRHVVVIPIGFVSDHMEVVYDLDRQAAEAAAKLGLGFVRAPTAGTAPEFVSMVRDLVVERIENRSPAWVGRLGARPVPCRPECCSTPRRR